MGKSKAEKAEKEARKALEKRNKNIISALNESAREHKGKERIPEALSFTKNTLQVDLLEMVLHDTLLSELAYYFNCAYERGTLKKNIVRRALDWCINAISTLVGGSVTAAITTGAPVLAPAAGMAGGAAGFVVHESLNSLVPSIKSQLEGFADRYDWEKFDHGGLEGISALFARIISQVYAYQAQCINAHSVRILAIVLARRAVWYVLKYGLPFTVANFIMGTRRGLSGLEYASSLLDSPLSNISGKLSNNTLYNAHGIACCTVEGLVKQAIEVTPTGQFFGRDTDALKYGFRPRLPEAFSPHDAKFKQLTTSTIQTQYQRYKSTITHYMQIDEATLTKFAAQKDMTSLTEYVGKGLDVESLVIIFSDWLAKPIDLSNKNLSYTIFVDSFFKSGSSFQGADLSCAFFNGSTLNECLFQKAICRETRFDGAYLEQANFSDPETRLAHARLCGAHLRGANFTDALEVLDMDFTRAHDVDKLVVAQPLVAKLQQHVRQQKQELSNLTAQTMNEFKAIKATLEALKEKKASADGDELNTIEKSMQQLSLRQNELSQRLDTRLGELQRSLKCRRVVAIVNDYAIKRELLNSEKRHNHTDGIFTWGHECLRILNQLEHKFAIQQLNSQLQTDAGADNVNSHTCTIKFDANSEASLSIISDTLDHSTNFILANERAIVYRILGEAYYQKQQFQLANVYYGNARHALHHDGSDAATTFAGQELLKFQGDALYNVLDYTNALSYYERVLAHTTDPLLKLKATYNAAGIHRSMAAACMRNDTECYKQHLTSAQGYYEQVIACFREHEEALSKHKELLSYAYNNVAGMKSRLYALGESNETPFDHHIVVMALQEASNHSVTPDFPKSQSAKQLTELAITYWKMSRLPDAAPNLSKMASAYLRSAINVDPTYARGQIVYAEKLLADKNPQGAVVAIENGLKQTGNDPCLRVVKCLADLNKQESAAGVFECLRATIQIIVETLTGIQEQAERDEGYHDYRYYLREQTYLIALAKAYALVGKPAQTHLDTLRSQQPILAKTMDMITPYYRFEGQEWQAYVEVHEHDLNLGKHANQVETDLCQQTRKLLLTNPSARKILTETPYAKQSGHQRSASGSATRKYNVALAAASQLQQNEQKDEETPSNTQEQTPETPETPEKT